MAVKRESHPLVMLSEVRGTLSLRRELRTESKHPDSVSSAIRFQGILPRLSPSQGPCSVLTKPTDVFVSLRLAAPLRAYGVWSWSDAQLTQGLSLSAQARLGNAPGLTSSAPNGAPLSPVRGLSQLLIAFSASDKRPTCYVAFICVNLWRKGFAFRMRMAAAPVTFCVSPCARASRKFIREP
jgi:hypothetical protein